MKICFLIQQYNNGGGTERVLSQIANGLVKKGAEVSVISIGKGLKPHFYTDASVSLFELSHTEPRDKAIGTRLMSAVGIIKVRKKLLDLTKKLLPDFIVAVDIVLYHYAEYLRRRLKIKAVGWEHYCLDSRQGPLLSYSRRLSVKNAYATVVISDGDYKSYKGKYPWAKNIVRIYNPISCPITGGADISAKSVAAAGRLTYQKGFDMLIEAWSKLPKRLKDWELNIYGEGEDKESLKERILFLGLKNVYLKGYTDNLAKELKKSSLFVLSSRYEGFGLVLIEAQAVGLPCISFNCKEGPSEIISDGENGILVPPCDVNSLTDGLCRLMDSYGLRIRFSNASMKYLDRFDPDRVIEKWISLFEDGVDSLG